MPDLIDINAPFGKRRDRFIARSVGTKFVAVQPNENTTEIELYDEIGFWGVNAKAFRAKLKDSGDVVLKINSPGGDVFEGIAIYNDLVSHKGNVRVEITGIAASIASIIAMAGKEIAMAENSMMMIHNAWTALAGNKETLLETADLLAKIDNALALTYSAQKGTPGIRAIKQMMVDETWMSAKEAKSNGFATELISKNDAVQAKFDLSPFSNVPKNLLWNDDDFEESETEEDIEKVLMRDAGYSRSRARALIKDVRAGNTSKNETTRDAGDVKLDGLLAAFQSWQITN